MRDCDSLFQHQLLPPIVHQTMKFVRDIGERYLWVDFLCLAHGIDDVLQEMERMDKIYAGALFTIITACANGLYKNEPGSLASDSDSSRSTSPMPPKTKSKVGNAMGHHYETLLGSKGAKRGWTNVSTSPGTWKRHIITTTGSSRTHKTFFVQFSDVFADSAKSSSTHSRTGSYAACHDTSFTRACFGHSGICYSTTMQLRTPPRISAPGSSLVVVVWMEMRVRCSKSTR